MIAILPLAEALALPCPDVGVLADRAWGSFQLAEIDEAQVAIDEAIASLGCQPRVVSTTELLELFQIQALLALSSGDDATMDLALRRAVATDHLAALPESHAPELQQRWRELAETLPRIEVSAWGQGSTWIDGRPLAPGQPLEIVAGLHLIQRLEAGRLDTELGPLEADAHLGGAPELAPPPPGPSLPPPDPVAAPTARRRPAALWLGALGAGGVSAFALASGRVSERSFLGSPYQADAFRGCAYGEACYPGARRDVIRGDALRINAAYGVGYATAGLSGGLLVLAGVGLPARDP